jgi:3-dehydroquinate synthetase
MSYMMRDKKNTDGALNLILARKIGQAFQAFDVPQDDVLNYLISLSHTCGVA